jgi:hypothetical protein
MMSFTHKQLMNKYHVQKTFAKNRNIEWQFTFESWIEWWGDDIDKRGSNKDSLVMARYKDQGPYHPNNVRKATVSENTNERNSRYLKEIMTTIGIFASIDQARQALKISISGLKYRIKRYPEQYYFTKEIYHSQTHSNNYTHYNI